MSITTSGGPVPWFLPDPSAPAIPIVGPLGGTAPIVSNLGGGNLNGTATTALLIGQSGTSGQRIAVPRQNTGNFTGVV